VNKKLDDAQKRMILNATGRKWELTFTTLVTFGGAFFASFPLFYSTSFGGAYWVWVLLLVTFVFQAVSYEFYAKKENLLGMKGFRIALMANGILAPFLVGTAVGTFFTGSRFTVDKAAIADPSAPVISTWESAWHGLEALAQPHAVILGLTVFALAYLLGALYLLSRVDDPGVRKEMYEAIHRVFFPFVALLVAWVVLLLFRKGYAVEVDGTVALERGKYFANLLAMPAVLWMFAVGVVLVLIGLIRGGFSHELDGFWYAAPGTVLVVMAVFFMAGFNNTAYYPSYSDIQSSLTIRNSSSSFFTLQVMSYVSLLIPFVVAYIVVAWRAMDRHKITKEELEQTKHKY
jgi:cytochrome d ubiquinol oxidase subunit II